MYSGFVCICIEIKTLKKDQDWKKKSNVYVTHWIKNLQGHWVFLFKGILLKPLLFFSFRYITVKVSLFVGYKFLWISWFIKTTKFNTVELRWLEHSRDWWKQFEPEGCLSYRGWIMFKPQWRDNKNRSRHPWCSSHCSLSHRSLTV